MKKLLAAAGVVLTLQTGMVLAQTGLTIEGMVGKRWAELDTDGVQATEFTSNIFYKLKNKLIIKFNKNWEDFNSKKLTSATITITLSDKGINKIIKVEILYFIFCRNISCYH